MEERLYRDGNFKIKIKKLFHKPATRHMALRYFACSSMKLQEVPHFFTENTTSRCTNFTLNSMAEKSLDLATIGIHTLCRTTL